MSHGDFRLYCYNHNVSVWKLWFCVSLYACLSVCRCLGSREVTPWTHNLIAVEFAVYVPYNVTYLNTSVWVGVTVQFSAYQIWAGQIQVNIVNNTANDMVSSFI